VLHYLDHIEDDQDVRKEERSPSQCFQVCSTSLIRGIMLLSFTSRPLITELCSEE